MTGDSQVVHLDQQVRRSRDELWAACSTPGGLSGWYADRVTGQVAPGGSVRLEWPGLGATVDLTVADYSEGTRVVFAAGQSRVTLGVSEGLVELSHEGLGAEDDVPGFRSSWRLALAHLAHGLEAHRGRQRSAAWLVRRAPVSAELAHLFFSEPSALSSWLGRTARFEPEGGQYALSLEDGRPMSGRVLVREPGHDVVLTWEGAGGSSTLTLRTLPSPRGEAERLIALSWSIWTEPGAGTPHDPVVLSLLRTAADRLITVLSRRGSA